MVWWGKQIQNRRMRYDKYEEVRLNGAGLSASYLCSKNGSLGSKWDEHTMYEIHRKVCQTGHQDAEARKQDGCAISRSWEPASKVTERQGNVPGNAGLGRRGAALGNYLYLFWLRWLHNKWPPTLVALNNNFNFVHKSTIWTWLIEDSLSLLYSASS